MTKLALKSDQRDRLLTYGETAVWGATQVTEDEIFICVSS